MGDQYQDRINELQRDLTSAELHQKEIKKQIRELEKERVHERQEQFMKLLQHSGMRLVDALTPNHSKRTCNDSECRISIDHGYVDCPRCFLIDAFTNNYWPIEAVPDEWAFRLQATEYLYHTD